MGRGRWWGRERGGADGGGGERWGWGEGGD